MLTKSQNHMNEDLTNKQSNQNQLEKSFEHQKKMGPTILANPNVLN
jgi:hypothetical protein